MTFEQRVTELGVDLSDLPISFAGGPEPYPLSMHPKAHGAAWAWYVREDQKAVPELERHESTRDRLVLRQYILHLVDIIDRMETRIVNLTGERDYLIDRYVGCDDCTYGADTKLCEEPCVSCENMEHFEWSVPEWSVPEDWRPDDAVC